MNLKPFEPHDLEIYIQLATNFHNSPASHVAPNLDTFKRNFKRILETPTVFGWLLVDGDETLGYALGTEMYTTEIGEDLLWIEEFHLEPQFRGKGYGPHYFELLVHEVPHVKRIRLEVADDNNHAKHLYKKKGFDYIDYEQMYFDK